MNLPNRPLSAEDMHAAAQHLACSDKGLNALAHLSQWMNENGCSLDQDNQAAVFELLLGCWGRWAGTAREEMFLALDQCTPLKQPTTHMDRMAERALLARRAKLPPAEEE